MKEINKRSPHLGLPFTKHSAGVPADERKLEDGDRLSEYMCDNTHWTCRVYRWWRADWTFVGEVRLPLGDGAGLEKRWDRGGNKCVIPSQKPRWANPTIDVDPTKFRDSHIHKHVALTTYGASHGFSIAPLDDVNDVLVIWKAGAQLLVKRGRESLLNHQFVGTPADCGMWVGEHACPQDFQI